jgi:hypothetical protein
VQLQHIVGRTLGIGVATGFLLSIGAPPAGAEPVPPARPGEVQIGEPLVIERDTPGGPERQVTPAGADGSTTSTRTTAVAAVAGALLLGSAGRRRWA